MKGGAKMDKRVTKTTIICIIITIVIIILVMGVDEWFGIDLGIFKWVIFAVATVVNCVIAANQATKVKKQETHNNTVLKNDVKSTEEQKKDKLVINPLIAIILTIVGITILTIFYLNAFELNLPEWAFLSAIIGFPLVILGLTSLILTNRKQK
jgi:uncharacterized protein (DUF983 family)